MYIGRTQFDYISIWCTIFLFYDIFSFSQDIMVSAKCHQQCRIHLGASLLDIDTLCMYHTFIYSVFSFFYHYCFVNVMYLNKTGWKKLRLILQGDCSICFSCCAALFPGKHFVSSLLKNAASEFIRRNIYDACSSQKTLKLEINPQFLYLWMEFFLCFCLGWVHYYMLMH